MTSSAESSPKRTKTSWNPLPDGGLLASAVTLCKATLGAGSLALPGSMMSTGIPLSVVLLIALGIMSMISINMIVRAQTHSKMDTFEELVRGYFNNLTGYLFEVAMVIFCFGTAVAYLITVADLLIPVFGKAFGPEHADAAYAYPFLNRTVLTIIVAIYSELIPRKESSMRIVSAISVSLCFFTYLTIGIFGFLTYGLATEGSIVTNMTQEFNNGDVFVTIAFILMALAVLAAYPLNIFPIRASVKATIRGISGRTTPFQWWIGPLIVIISIILSVVVAIYLPDVQTVLYFVGSVTGSYIVYVVPGGFCVRLLKSRFYAEQLHRARLATVEECPSEEAKDVEIVNDSTKINDSTATVVSRSKFDYSAVTSWGMIILGLVFFVVGSYQSVVDVIDFYSS
ncbi:amino acid transporter, putative [Perkinsus marinus ATCC 50983]|uniref:Amino acid transporter, putative n=1 Tax=Perkinsus marinus (strain ATCC 50983 / TXsc) TaxID=423536 RepID=C5L7L6_PERM5|nr:amino acid transporter, putative [Perkinsus marinus ATCC 50983]EER07478.1 amino acid transporter, putative [Perkinsus marinus ATCC 50983]|eukprot:XP_002775662.1 amino acid transporter, putative [Perkinsus marinus ATCC 50983]